MSMSDQANIISHHRNAVSLENVVKKIKSRILNEGDKPHVSVQKQLALLADLQQFEVGRFLIHNRGINGFWTDYILTHPERGRKTGRNFSGALFSDLEKFLLDRAPTMLATQQRFKIFLRENQKCVCENASLACIPSGLMGELRYLDFQNIRNIRLVGVDLDKDALSQALQLAKRQKLQTFVELKNENAWHLSARAEFDLISSNGLSIYEACNNRLLRLYKAFYQALKSGGKLITSFLTHPRSADDPQKCCWNLQQVNQADLLLQKIIFDDVLKVKWQCFRSEKETEGLLEKAGFKEIRFIDDQARIFPTVIALK